MKCSAVIIFIGLLYFGCHQAEAQDRVAQGRVIDSRSLHALPFATVYFNNTTIGTTTDAKGMFQLRGFPAGEYDLVVSYVGYKPFHAPVNLLDTDTVLLEIQLEPSLTSLGEVQINSKKDAEWHQDLRRFEKLFFGDGRFASLCKILNPWLLDFKRDKEGTFQAECAEPLEIENLALGYKVTYLMKAFEVTSKNHNITGYARFQEMTTPDSALARLWSRNRQQAYLGSPRHLFKSLVNREVSSQGFVLYEDKTLNPDIVRNFTFQLNFNESIVDYNTFDKVLPGISPDRFTVRFPSRLEVHFMRKTATPTVYRNVPRPVSWIEVAGGSLTVNEQGTVLNPSRLTLLGAMGEIRVADLLPYDYVTGSTPAVISSVHRPLELLEKPYLHTDRDYYYTNDLLLFKAYINYTIPLLRDSLSHVLHVQLLEQSGKVVVSKNYPIVNGRAAGDFFLGNGIVPGDYQLRAYTNWMLNFDERHVYQKAIRILRSNELAKPGTVTPSASMGFTILTSKESYQPREKILIALENISEIDNLLGSDLSVTVVDEEQSAALPERQMILSDFDLPSSASDSKETKINHRVQLGIPFSGAFVSKRKKHPEGILRVHQRHTDDVLTIPTDAEGCFYRELEILDTANLFVLAKDLKGKVGKVIFDSVTQPMPVYKAVPPQRFDVVIPTDQSRYHVPDPSAYTRILSEVVIEGRKVNSAQVNKPIHVDYQIDGASLRSSTSGDFLTELQRRVPGLRVIYKMEGGGTIRKYMSFPGAASFEDPKTGEPLVVVDGLALNGDDEPVTERLSSMNPGDIDKVEVFRFGSAAAYGARSANGVIVVTTRNGEVDQPAVLDFKDMQAVNLRGYASTTDFDAPDYSTMNSIDDRLDARATIYWNPWVTATDRDNISISFFAADIPTTYRIIVEGLSKDRKLYWAEKVIRIASP